MCHGYGHALRMKPTLKGSDIEENMAGTGNYTIVIDSADWSGSKANRKKPVTPAVSTLDGNSIHASTAIFYF